MRIVFISREYAIGEAVGGIGTYTTTIARALARRGHEVSVITRGGEGEIEGEQGVRVISLEHRWVPGRDARLLLDRRRIAVAVSGLRPDVVQAAEWQAEAWWVSRFGSPPVITRFATPTYLIEELNRRTPDPHTDLVRRLERDQARRSDALLAPSRAIADRVSHDWGVDPAGVEVIRNPVDLEAVRAAAAAEPGIELPSRFLLFFGRIERRKGIEVFAHALPSVLEAHRDVHVVLAGRDTRADGGAPVERLWWERADEAHDRIHVLGELPRHTALSVAARAELVVLPSLWEAFGFVAVEALALGRPVVASSGSGFAEIIEDGLNGWLVPPGDSRALAEVLVATLGDRTELRRVSEAARDRADRFAADEVASEVEDLYERVIGAKGIGPITPDIYTRGYRRYFRPEDRRNPFRRLYDEKRRAVLAIFDELPPSRVLDVGGGPGRLAAPLSERHEVTLCDVSNEMLAEARRRCGDSIRLVRADARELPFEPDSFDAALALDVMVHLPDLEEGLRDLVRVVRPGGTIVVDTTNAVPWWVLAYPGYVDWRPRRLLRTMWYRGVLPEWRHTVRHQRKKEVRATIVSLGLELIERRDFGPRFSSKWHLWRLTKSEGRGRGDLGEGSGR